MKRRMKRLVFDDVTGNFLYEDEGTPECGKDFCDTCGDCLACYNGDYCTYNCLWIVYQRDGEEVNY